MTKQASRRLILAGVVLAVIAAAIAVLRTSYSQVPTVAIVNYVTYPILDESIRGIKAELADRGFKADNIRIIEVNANGQTELLNTIVQEILSKRPSVIVPVSTPVARAIVKAAGAKQPIVFSTVTNPQDVGMSDHPANVTGVSDVVNYSANVELIQQLFPSAKKIGHIYNPGEANSQFGVEETRKIAASRNLELVLATVAGSAEVVDAARILAQKVDVFYVGSDNTVAAAINGLLSVANEHRIPVIASDSGSVEQGALAGVSVNYFRVGREVGRIVAQVLDTKAQPGTIPNVLFRGDELILNEPAAKKISYEFPDVVRRRAKRILP